CSNDLSASVLVLFSFLAIFSAITSFGAGLNVPMSESLLLVDLVVNGDGMAMVPTRCGAETQPAFGGFGTTPWRDRASQRAKRLGPMSRACGRTEVKDITCIEDLRELHRRKVPKAFFDYVDHGSYAEETLRANRADLEAIKFRQRILRDISVRDQRTK